MNIQGETGLTHAQAATLHRVVQAGAIPVTWQQVLLEYQRDWARMLVPC